MELVRHVAPWLRCCQIVELVPPSCAFLDVGIERLDVFLIIGSIDWIPGPLVALSVEQNRVVDVAVNRPALLRIAVRAAPLPNDFAAEVLRAEHAVEQNVQVTRSRWVAMQVQ